MNTSGVHQHEENFHSWTSCRTAPFLRCRERLPGSVSNSALSLRPCMADTCIPMLRDSIIIAVWYEYGYLLKTGIIGPRGYHNPDRVACHIQTVQSVAANRCSFLERMADYEYVPGYLRERQEKTVIRNAAETNRGALPGLHHQVQCAFMPYLRSTSFEVSLNSLRSRRSRYIL